MIPPRKYLTEASLNLHTSTVVMLPPDQLHADATAPTHVLEAMAECNIYLICRRPALSFDPNTFRWKPPFAAGHFLRRVDGQIERINFLDRLAVPRGGEVRVDVYPHRRAIATNSRGEDEFYFPALMIAQKAQVSDLAIRHFEVLYVGQAYADGKRAAIDRLRSHQTLQRILAELAAANPDDEVMLFLFKYEPAQYFLSMDGVAGAEITGEQDTRHVQRLIKNPPSRKEEIALAEAGLIRYFEPPYNEIYKASFPAEQLKILEGCYERDFVSLSVEINTEDVRARLWSEKRDVGYHHIASFDLHDSQKRRSFFSLIDREGNYTVTEMSGPAF